MKKIFLLILTIALLCSWLVACGWISSSEKPSDQPTNGSGNTNDQGNEQGTKTWDGGLAYFLGDASVSLDYLSNRFLYETSVFFSKQPGADGERFFFTKDFNDFFV